MKNCKLLVFFSLVFVLFSCGDAQLTEGEYLERGKKHFSSRDYRSAVIELKNAVQKNGQNAEARWLLGKSYLMLGDGASAEKELRRTKELGVKDKELELALAKALLMGREYEKLVDEFKSSVDPGDRRFSGSLLTYFAEAMLERRNFSESDKFIKQAYDYDSTSPLVLIGMTRNAIIRGQLDQARQYIFKAIELEPNNSEVWYAAGDYWVDLKDYSEAEKAFEKSNSIEKGPSLTHIASKTEMGLIRVKLALNKLDEAQTHLKILEKANPKHIFVSYFRGVIAFRRGQFSEALSSFQDVEKRYPEFMPNVLMLGTTHFAMNSLAQAEQTLSRFLLSVPNNIPARKTMALLQLRLENPQQAMKALGDSGKQSAEDIELLSIMADAAIQMGDYSRGTGLINQAIDKTPGNSDQLKIKLASAELSRGNADAAIRQIEKTFSGKDKPLQAATLEVFGYLQKHDVPNALRNAKELVIKYPDSAQVYNLLGSVYLASGDNLAAKKQFEVSIQKDSSFVVAHNNLGSIAENEKQYSEAKKHYEQANLGDRGNSTAMLGLARLSLIDRDVEGAVRWWEKTRKSDKKAIQPRVDLARYSIAKQDLVTARKLSEELDSISKSHPESLKLRGAIFSADNKHAEAEQVYEALVKVDNSVENYIRLASTQIRLKKDSAAQSTLARAIKLDPESVSANSMLTAIDLARGNYFPVFDRAKKLQVARPKSVAGFLMEGDAFVAKKEYLRAAEAYGLGIKVAKASVLVQKQAAALYEGGRTQEALTVLSSWLETNKGDRQSTLELAMLKSRSGDKAGALFLFEEVIKQDANNLLALNEAALLLHALGKKQNALTYAEKAYELSPRMETSDTLGWILVQTGGLNRGLGMLKKAAQDKNAPAEVHYHYAYALNQTGDKQTAKQILKTVLSTNKPFSDREQAKRLLDTL